jgi:uncharacterized protein
VQEWFGQHLFGETIMPQMPENIAVWFEIPVSDLERSRIFYETVLAMPTHRDDNGPNPLINIGSEDLSGVAGHLYPGKPAAKGTGNTIHVTVGSGTLEEALARVAPAGGEVVSPVITIPPGRFAYCLDPDGNSIGIFVR